MQDMLQWVRYSNQVGFNFNGRARRSEYWYNALFYFMITFIASLCVGAISGVLLFISSKFKFVVTVLDIGLAILNIIVFIKMLPIAVRRLHDTNKSGWIYLICLVTSLCCGIGTLIFLLFMCQDSMPGNNTYGSNPKGIG